MDRNKYAKGMNMQLFVRKLKSDFICESFVSLV